MICLSCQSCSCFIVCNPSIPTQYGETRISSPPWLPRVALGGDPNDFRGRRIGSPGRAHSGGGAAGSATGGPDMNQRGPARVRHRHRVAWPGRKYLGGVILPDPSGRRGQGGSVGSLSGHPAALTTVASGTLQYPPKKIEPLRGGVLRRGSCHVRGEMCERGKPSATWHGACRAGRVA